MIIFPGDYVLHQDVVYRVVDTDADMMVMLDNGKWIEASERDIQGYRSAPEIEQFVLETV